jgi:hypothetical protein
MTRRGFLAWVIGSVAAALGLRGLDLLRPRGVVRGPWRKVGTEWIVTSTPALPGALYTKAGSTAWLASQWHRHSEGRRHDRLT